MHREPLKRLARAYPALRNLQASPTPKRPSNWCAPGPGSRPGCRYVRPGLAPAANIASINGSATNGAICFDHPPLQTARTVRGPRSAAPRRGFSGPAGRRRSARRAARATDPPGTRSEASESVSLSIIRLIAVAPCCPRQLAQGEVLEPHARMKHLRLMAGQIDQALRIGRLGWDVAVGRRPAPGGSQQLGPSQSRDVRQRASLQIIIKLIPNGEDSRRPGRAR